jgi:ArsR family transcriptional regulator
MNRIINRKYETRARIIKAMAHPARLFILEKLKEGELCVNEVKDLLGLDVSTVSRHLSVLKNEGLVYDEKRGNCVYYNLLVPCVLDFMSCVEAVIEARAMESVSGRCQACAG